MTEKYFHFITAIGAVKQAVQTPVTMALVIRMLPAIALIVGLAYGYGELHANMKHMEESLTFAIESSHDEIHAELKGFREFDEAAHFSLKEDLNENTDRINELVKDFYIPSHGSTR